MSDVSYAAMINVDWHLRRCTPLAGRKHLVVQFKYLDFEETYTFPGTVDKVLDIFEKQVCFEEKEGRRIVEWFKILECDIDKLYEEDIPELYFKPELVFMEIYYWPVTTTVRKYDFSKGFDFSLRNDKSEDADMNAITLSSPIVSDIED